MAARSCCYEYTNTMPHLYYAYFIYADIVGMCATRASKTRTVFYAAGETSSTPPSPKTGSFCSALGLLFVFRFQTNQRVVRRGHTSCAEAAALAEYALRRYSRHKAIRDGGFGSSDRICAGVQSGALPCTPATPRSASPGDLRSLAVLFCAEAQPPPYVGYSLRWGPKLREGRHVLTGMSCWLVG